MKYFIYLSFVILSSCLVMPKYYLHTEKSLNNFSIKGEDKFVLIKNNFYSVGADFSNKVDSDFSNIIKNLSLNPSFLEFSNEKFIHHLNEEQLDIIRNETKCEYILLIQTILKPSILHQKSFTSITTYEKNKEREYHVILQLIDIDERKVLYSKESMSKIKISYEYSTSSTTQYEQLLKTYNILYKDFKEQLLKTK
ncbi:hypothetical protein ACTS91_17510 [Empedobacter falsenii]